MTNGFNFFALQSTFVDLDDIETLKAVLDQGDVRSLT